jgi:hypothetical protein
LLVKEENTCLRRQEKLSHVPVQGQHVVVL